MSRLIVVSNRLPSVPSSRIESFGRETTAGGLAAAILAALRSRPGSSWIGWNGRSPAVVRPGALTRTERSGVEMVSLGLSHAEFESYYLGFCNQTLWPVLHCFQGRLRTRLRDEAAYEAAQGRFADAVQAVVRQGDILWVHDYHLFLLGQELRRRGWRGRIGFFLHTPFPPLEMWEVLPHPRAMLEGLLAYDQVGFHVQGFLDNYVYCAQRLLGARSEGGMLYHSGRVQRAAVYPVGIDPKEWMLSGRPDDRRHFRGRGDRRLILGVDRLDYTKGILERIRAFERFLHARPDWRRRVVYVQIASPSRIQVPEYSEQRRRIEALLGRVNGELSEPDWTPIRYLYRSYGQADLARFYREADIGLVTPLRDGMNLVAKEYVAAQDPADPGVLILSRTAGAAQQMRDAVLVNPFVPADQAQGIATALEMSLDERRRRHAALLRQVREATAAGWAERFLDDLDPGTDVLPTPQRAAVRERAQV
ncbi:MAG TPA: trehalose-6-phosphate synthase [Candidatus Polarisedimenticolia bacterium]|jgi:trehalose 6-phosphate synthase|nr:trehalose-6-phosphate synthase [Candidatus Polarisedimenticolia bacterium]